MEFYIRKNGTLPILKMKAVNDGRGSYKDFTDLLEVSSIYFTMVNIENGIPKISSQPAYLVPLDLPLGSEPEYYIYYEFKASEINRKGRYKGEFLIKHDTDNLILPLREELFINILESVIDDPIPVYIPTPTPTPYINEIVITGNYFEGSIGVGYSAVATYDLDEDILIQLTNVLGATTGQSITITTGITISQGTRQGFTQCFIDEDYTNLTKISRFPSLSVSSATQSVWTFNLKARSNFDVTPTPTNTTTPTVTPTLTPTNTTTPTVTPTITDTPTNTPTTTTTRTNTPTNTVTSTNTATQTQTPTNTPTQTPTNTNTQTQTNTATQTQTQTPTNTTTQTQTSTPTNTSTQTPTTTPTQTVYEPIIGYFSGCCFNQLFAVNDIPVISAPTIGATYFVNSVGFVGCATSIVNPGIFVPNYTYNALSIYTDCVDCISSKPCPTPTPTTTSTNTPTQTPTLTTTNTSTQTSTITSTPTNTITQTSTQTPTVTPTNTVTNTRTQTPTQTPTQTQTNTPTQTQTNTPTNTNTSTQTPTNTNTSTQTPTNTNTSTQTPTNTSTQTPTQTPTSTIPEPIVGLFSGCCGTGIVFLLEGLPFTPTVGQYYYVEGSTFSGCTICVENETPSLPRVFFTNIVSFVDCPTCQSSYACPTPTPTKTPTQTPTLTPVDNLCGEFEFVTPTPTTSTTPTNTPTPTVTPVFCQSIYNFNLINTVTVPTNGQLLLLDGSSSTAKNNFDGLNGGDYLIIWSFIDSNNQNAFDYFNNLTSVETQITFCQNGKSAVYSVLPNTLLASSVFYASSAGLTQIGSANTTFNFNENVNVLLEVLPEVSPTPTQTQTNTTTPTNTSTQSQTPTMSNTPTITTTPTNSITPSVTASQTPTRTQTPSATYVPPTLRMTFQSPDSNPTVAELPLVSGGTYDFTVNWGDGSSDVINSWTDSKKTHTYSNNSSYNVTVVGVIKGFSYSEVSDTERGNLRTITEWGPLEISGNTGVLAKCFNLTSFASNGPILTTSNALTRFFYGCTLLGNVSNFQTWNISKVNSFQGLFENCSSLEASSMNLDTKNIVNMNSMFAGCQNFDTDVSSWNTSGVTNMDYMFYRCTKFNQNIGSWNTSNVTSMTHMFESATTFNYSLNSWNVSKVTDMSSMFKGAISFSGRVDWGDIRSLTGLTDFMVGITYPTTNYNSILNIWATSPSVQNGVTADFGTIQYTSAGEASRNILTSTYGWTINDGGIFPPVTPTQTPTQTPTRTSTQTPTNTATNTNSPTRTPTNTNTSSITPSNTPTNTPTPSTTRTVAFRTTWQSPNESETVAEIPLIPKLGGNLFVDWGDGTSSTLTSSTDPSRIHLYANSSAYQVTVTDGAKYSWNFYQSTVSQTNRNMLKSVDEWGTFQLTDPYGLFQNCGNLNLNIVFDVLDTSLAGGTADFGRMFEGCSGLTTIDKVDSWDMTQVTGTSYMFSRTNMGVDGIRSWNTQNILDMTEMFSFNPSVTGKLNSWDVSNVINMSGMFRSATNVYEDISNWNVLSVTDMSDMFRDATSFNVDISPWTVSGVTNMSGMFRGASIFNQNLNGWDVSNVTNMSGMFRGATTFNQNLNGWDVSNVTNMSAMFNDATSFDGAIDSWAIDNVSDLTEFMTGMNYSTANYDNLLLGWSQRTVQSDVTADFGSIQYSSTGRPGRDILTDPPNNWTINDGGQT